MAESARWGRGAPPLFGCDGDRDRGEVAADGGEGPAVLGAAISLPHPPTRGETPGGVPGVLTAA